MAQTGTCPICEWPVREHRRCPCCGWELESDELIVGDADLPKRFQRRLNETRERWQEAAEAYRSGRLGFGEEAIERLRQRLQEQGFRLGQAFLAWARAHPPAGAPPPSPRVTPTISRRFPWAEVGFQAVAAGLAVGGLLLIVRLLAFLNIWTWNMSLDSLKSLMKPARWKTFPEEGPLRLGLLGTSILAFIGLWLWSKTRRKSD